METGDVQKKDLIEHPENYILLTTLDEGLFLFFFFFSFHQTSFALVGKRRLLNIQLSILIVKIEFELNTLNILGE